MALLVQTLFGTIDRVSDAITLLRKHEPDDGYYVAFSGGKDSCVLLDLVKRSGVKYDAHFNLTSVDPPELLAFIKAHHPDVMWHKPQYTMFELIRRERMPPMRNRRYCTRQLKQTDPDSAGRLVTGVRRGESKARSTRQPIERRDGKQIVHPLVDWSTADIWHYIRDNNVPYCSLYDEGFKRLGCVMCPMGGRRQMIRDATRWPEIAQGYRLAFDDAVAAQRERGYNLFRDGDDMFDWWVGGGRALGNGRLLQPPLDGTF